MTSRTTDDDAAIEAEILAAVGRRGPGKTICPSEIARARAGSDGWRLLMPAVRAAAGRLAARGALSVTRGGKTVPAGDPGGPIRLGVRRADPR